MSAGIETEVKRTIRCFERALENPIVFPGGYELAVYLADGERICHQCAEENASRIIESTLSEARDGWELLGCDVYWEGPDESCCECGKTLSSEYGDPDAEEGEQP